MLQRVFLTIIWRGREQQLCAADVSAQDESTALLSEQRVVCERGGRLMRQRRGALSEQRAY